jgi:general stress protein YciG
MIPDENKAGGPEQSSEQSNNPTTTTPATPSAMPATPSDASHASGGEERRPRRRGFAAMDQTRVKEIASKGGKAAHAAGTAHQFSSDEARNAGRKGGMAPHVRRGGVRRRPTETANATTPAATPASDERTGEGR